jgi:hypothetical protein
MRIAWPVPTATTRTLISVAPVNFGRMCENRPELSVEVVEAMVMKRSLAAAGEEMATRKPAATTAQRRMELKDIGRISLQMARAFDSGVGCLGRARLTAADYTGPLGPGNERSLSCDLQFRGKALRSRRMAPVDSKWFISQAKGPPSRPPITCSSG